MDNKFLTKMVKILREDVRRNIEIIMDLQDDNDKIKEALKRLYQEKETKDKLVDKLIKELNPLLERANDK